MELDRVERTMGHASAPQPARADRLCAERPGSLPLIGRFAPSPTGSLHPGSLLAAVGSWLFARRAGGRWLVRIEDLDRPRVVPGSADEILATLKRYGLEWDGPVVKQSDRLPAYARALEGLSLRSLVYDCGCSRAEILRAASAPLDREALYPVSCRDGLGEGKQPRAVRFRVPPSRIRFDDLVVGQVEEDLPVDSGDFVLKRADGVFAYQLAVVVDDSEQGVTQVIRGGDLLASTARQIALQQALEVATPVYGHLPVVVAADGSKYGKRDGALALERLDETMVRRTLVQVLALLGIADVPPAAPAEMLRNALRRFEPASIPKGSVTWDPTLLPR